MIIDDFKLWIDINYEKIFQYGLILTDSYEYKSENDIENSLVLTYVNSAFISQLTIRNEGFIDIEILPEEPKEDENLGFYLHCMTNKNINFDSLMKNYFDYFDQFCK